MKTKIQTLLLAMACLAVSARAAVMFSLAPGTVSNTYPGVITLQITGLTNNETVVVQKYLDVNGNGVVDAGDWLEQQFDLTDGQPGMAIGGITNLNVPGDTDTTPGQITAQLFFWNGDFMQNIVGQYAYVVSSPSGRFNAITNVLTVTNAGYGQAITGSVVSNNSSTTLPNSMVLLMGPGKGKPVAGTLTDHSGSYRLAAPPGTYNVLAVQANYVANTATLPSITLGSGETNTANVSLTAATASISGRYVDAGNTNLGLPGIMVSAQANGGLMAFGGSDAGGSFTIGVQSGQWSIGPNDPSFIVNGYLRLQNKTNVAAGTTGLIYALPKANALFYGIVLDSQGNPMMGLEMQDYDNNNLYEGESFTGTNGEFALGALGGLSNDQWSIQVSSDATVTNYMFSQPGFEENGGTNLSSGQSVLAVFTALLATNTISGSLTDGGGNPFTSIGVWANATINGVTYSPYMDTDSQGHYSMQVGNGTWTVGVNTYGGNDNLPVNYVCPSQMVVISNNNATVNFVATVPTNTISGTLKDNNGNPIGGVQVWANGGNNSQQADTDGSGHYSLTVGPGTWTVGINASGGGNSLPAGYLCPQNQTVVIGTANGTANFTALAATQSITGSLHDDSGNPLAGIGLCAYVQIGGVGYNAVVGDTDADGRYTLSVVNGNWQVYLLGGGGSDSLPGNYLCPPSQPVVIFNAGGTANFIAPLETYSIYGSVKDSSGNPIAGVGVGAGATINSVGYGVYTDTDGNGDYTLNVAGGAWDVSVNCSGGSDSLGSLGDYACPGDQFAMISGNNGTVNFTVQLCGGIAISPSMPAGEVGAYYDQYLQASSCNGSFTWSFVSGSPPPGVTGNPSTGEIYGTPTEAGTFPITVKVTDGDGLTTNAQITIGISNAVQITTASLPNGTNGSAYSQQLQATGGQPPYSWSLYSGSLPPGLSLSDGGLISGEALLSGTISFSAQVTDNAGGFATQFFPISLTIVPGTNAQTIVVKSDANTLAASRSDATPLDNGNTSGLTFQAVLVGAYGTSTAAPPGAPSGTEVVQIPPADGESGFFRVTFVLPQTFSGVQLAGSANVDDSGRVFLNGHPLSPSLTSGDPAVITEFGNATFWTTNAGWFVAGTNQILVADLNTGGPSGAAFYAAISFQAGPPVLGAPVLLANGQFQFLLNGAAGQNYTIQMSTNLGSSNWTTVCVTNCASSNSFSVNVGSATGNERFYRVKAGP